MEKVSLQPQKFANIIMTDTHIFTVSSVNKEWLYSTDTQVRIRSRFENAENGKVEFEEGEVLIYVRATEENARPNPIPCEVQSTRKDDSEEDWGEDDEGEWE